MYTRIAINLDSVALAKEVIQDLPYLRKSIAWLDDSNALNVTNEKLDDLIEALNDNKIGFIRPAQY